MRAILTGCAILVACTGKTPEKSGAIDTAASDTMAAPAPPDSGNEIHITTNAASYAPGAAIGLSIHNATGHQFAFNPCTRHFEFEREAHGDVTEPNRMCTMEAWLLDPNGTREASVNLPAAIEPGTYRVRIDFAAQDQSGLQLHVTSNPFTVTRSE